MEGVVEERRWVPGEVKAALPDAVSYRAASDKVALMSLAELAGLAVPQSLVLHGPADVVGTIPESWFPCVIKPHRSVVRGDGHLRKPSVTLVAGAESCEPTLTRLPAG